MSPGDVRRNLYSAGHWWHEGGDLRRDTEPPPQCPHEMPTRWAVTCCPDCEVDRQTDRALAWGLTAATLAAAVLVGGTWAVARVLGG